MFKHFQVKRGGTVGQMQLGDKHGILEQCSQGGKAPSLSLRKPLQDRRAVLPDGEHPRQLEIQ